MLQQSRRVVVMSLLAALLGFTLSGCNSEPDLATGPAPTQAAKPPAGSSSSNVKPNPPVVNHEVLKR